jgi:hypothetical protein
MRAGQVVLDLGDCCEHGGQVGQIYATCEVSTVTLQDSASEVRRRNPSKTIPQSSPHVLVQGIHFVRPTQGHNGYVTTFLACLDSNVGKARQGRKSAKNAPQHEPSILSTCVLNIPK